MPERLQTIAVPVASLPKRLYPYPLENRKNLRKSTKPSKTNTNPRKHKERSMNNTSLLRALIVSASLAVAACVTDTGHEQTDISPLNDQVPNDNVSYAIQNDAGVRSEDLNFQTRDG